MTHHHLSRRRPGGHHPVPRGPSSSSLNRCPPGVPLPIAEAGAQVVHPFRTTGFAGSSSLQTRAAPPSGSGCPAGVDRVLRGARQRECRDSLGGGAGRAGYSPHGGRHRAGTGHLKRSRRPTRSPRPCRHTSPKSTRLIRSAPLRRAPSPTRSSSCGRLASVWAKDCEPSRLAPSPSLTRSPCATNDPPAPPRDMPVSGPSLCAAVRSPPGWSSAAPTSSLPTALAGDSDVFRLGSLLALGDVEFDLLPFLEAAVAAAGDRAEVHEHVRAALDRDEAVALVAVEPLHGALRHFDLLGCGCA